MSALLCSRSCCSARRASAVAAGTEIRALTVTLVDEKGREVADVSLDDVALVENGLHRDVASFERDQRPLAVAILVDTQRGRRAAAYRLNVVDAVVGLVSRLPEGTRYSIWTTGDRPTKLVDYTDDRGAAGAALRRVAPQGGNYMLDALAEASADLAKKAREGERRAVVAVTGTGTGVQLPRQAASGREGRGPGGRLPLRARRRGRRRSRTPRERLSYALDRLATASGGRDEHVLSYMGLDSTLKKLSASLVSAYRLRYASVPDLKKRKLELQRRAARHARS